MIAKSRIFEVYESYEKRSQLYKINLVPGKKVYGERLIQENGCEYREWDANKSKLASSILKGSPNVGIRKNDAVLYLGSASGTTVSHVSDIVGNGGLIFAVDIAARVMRDFIFFSYQKKNPRQIEREVKGRLEEKMRIIDQGDMETCKRGHSMINSKKREGK